MGVKYIVELDNLIRFDVSQGANFIQCQLLAPLLCQDHLFHGHFIIGADFNGAINSTTAMTC